MDKKTTFNVWYFVAAFAGILLLQGFIASFAGTKPIAYSEFQQLLRDGRVTEVAVSDRFISGAVKEPFSSGESRFTTTRVDEDFAEQLGKFNVKVTGQIESTFLRDLLSWVVPVLLFGAVWFFLMRRMSAGGGLGGGLMSIGKSKAKVYVETDTGVTFADVAGVDEAKQELQEVVDFLKNPQHYGRLGGRMPKGVLLVGPPGTGKTLIAKAVAGEAKVPFFSISGSEFVEMFVGVGAARVRDLFEQARALAPAIIFIDELDAMGRSRLPGAMGGGNDEKEQTLNQLLVELDGFDTKSGVVLLAATNRPEILDPALLRAGRFDRQVLVDRPDKHGRVQILTVHLKKIIVGADVEPEAVAALTPGFTGADLANLVNEAALLATRRNADAVAMTDFNNAIERIIAGLEKKNRLINPKEREIVAFHEMGHAITAMAIPGSDPVHKVSIIPRGIGALGYTIQRPLEDRYIVTRAELENKMVVLLGGRAAEWIVFQHLSTGASDDLRRVTDIARSMVVQYGMSPTLGNVTYERDQRGMLGGMAIAAERAYAETTASQIDREVHDLAEHAFDRAVTILTERRPLLDATAHKLLETETLDGAAINAIAAGMARPSGEASGSKHASGGKGPGAL